MPYHTDIRYMISDRYVFFRPVTDHKAVYLSIFGRNLFHLKSVASLKQHNVRRRIFNYDNMDDDKSQLFTDQTDIELQLFLNHQMTLHTSAALDYWWGILQRCINKAAIKTIDNHVSSGSHKDPQPKHLSDAHNNIRFLNKCLYVIRSKCFKGATLLMYKNVGLNGIQKSAIFSQFTQYRLVYHQLLIKPMFHLFEKISVPYIQRS